MKIRPEKLKNPLIRDGVSQRQRQVPALSPDFVKVDENDLGNFLVFAYRFSEQVIYYNDNNDADGNWQAFFNGNTPIQIALISKTRPQKIKDQYSQHLRDFLSELSSESGQSNQKFERFADLLATWIEILQQIYKWYTSLESYTPLQSVIRGLVKTNFREPILRIWAFEQAYVAATKKVFNSVDIYTKFNKEFGLNLTPPAGDRTPFNANTVQVRDELDAVFQILFQNYYQIIQQAPQYLEKSLQARQDHQPYLALYLAFLEVMKPARDDLNLMTQRHLDFFYRQVLRLRDRPAQPDHAHLIFELIKSQTEFALPAGTRFKAGKDATGKDLFYSLDADIVIHKAQITSLKGLFLDLQAVKPGEKPPRNLGLYSSPAANSFDGQGGDFPKEQTIKTWLPFGNDKRQATQLGLAIASDVLLLQESERVIQFTFSLSGLGTILPENKLHEVFEVYLSGEKEWIKANILPSGAAIPNGGTEKTGWNNSELSLVVVLAAEIDPVLPYLPDKPIPYNPDVPNFPLTLQQATPVARIQLKTQALVNNLPAYHYFRTAKLDKVTISTRVKEVRNLVVQNDLGVLDATKPFQPFGPRPAVGSKFYVGSREIFLKNLSDLQINITWEKLPAVLKDHYRGYYVDGETPQPNFDNFSAQLALLTKRTWSETDLKNPYKLFPSGDRTLVKASATPLQGEEIDNFTSLNNQTSSGFLRFSLNQDFLHEEFVTKYATQTLAAAKDFADGKYVNDAVYEDKDNKLTRWHPGVDLPKNTVAPITLNQPYTPTIQSLYLKYTAVATTQDCTIFHLYPFGGFEHLEAKQPDFLPQFTNEGELLIGLENLDPPTALPLLFQVAEASADTALKKADVNWFYLQDNTWKSLSDRIVSDNTNGLIASGIIHLGIPADISKAKTTILDPNLYWLKVSVPARSGAICQILGVHTQAARVSFTDESNDPNHLANPLPAGTIAKQDNPDPEVKTIEQPYNSFGGKIKEQPSDFYIRISEHLRHKGRAVTIFDYERLVLEKFPEIYKVRCINHGQVDQQNDKLQELTPGSVTLAVIPNLALMGITNELEPKVNINLLQQIEKYLASISSPWAAIQVVNPAYEHIQVEFQVKFKSPYSANFGYYSRQLEQAITYFLAPWTMDTQAEIQFGGKLYRSAIVNFIEKQEYIDYVVDFKMHQDTQRDIREAIASTARSVLTSVSLKTSAQSHIIQEFQEKTIVPNQKIESAVLGYESLENLELL
ncbi:hypothetical protein HCG51_06265 [Tolypothrix sp. PCC 7910]|uniref:hypothetical protein n=1 Tax=Tolypothrix sp. PCC 7910 TaxID=2099387 RepID=UPI001427746D|nr:hypothetical protein [Tolypothrix sp. PCC 7910]QIR36401.1 hypothetical protein HCG51_06265 [Tolypothrix sp. PCC 7910]